MCMKNNTILYVARTSNNRVISSGDLYCCLLPRCETLRTCRSGFPIAKKWCCDQDVKVVRSSAFTQRTCDRCGSLWKREDVVNTIMHVARTSNNGVISSGDLYCICCLGAKLCAHGARDFRSQQYNCLLSMSERTRTKKKVKENKGRNKERNPLRKWTVGNPFLQHQVTWRLTGPDKQKLPMWVKGNRFQVIQQATRGRQKQSPVYNDSDWRQKRSQQKTGNFCCGV